MDPTEETAPAGGIVAYGNTAAREAYPSHRHKESGTHWAEQRATLNETTICWLANHIPYRRKHGRVFTIFPVFLGTGLDLSTWASSRYLTWLSVGNTGNGPLSQYPHAVAELK